MEQIKQIYIALARAVEEGDPLRIGIVLGQTLSKLETIINGQLNTSENNLPRQ